MPKKNILQFVTKTLAEKKWDAISQDFYELYLEGWREDVIFSRLSDKYFLKPNTIKSRLKTSKLKREANQVLNMKYKQRKLISKMSKDSSPLSDQIHE